MMNRFGVSVAAFWGGVSRSLEGKAKREAKSVLAEGAFSDSRNGRGGTAAVSGRTYPDGIVTDPDDKSRTANPAFFARPSPA
jgi:hypothetical protein